MKQLRWTNRKYPLTLAINGAGLFSFLTQDGRIRGQPTLGKASKNKNHEHKYVKSVTYSRGLRSLFILKYTNN